jgi:hypothetical protein
MSEIETAAQAPDSSIQGPWLVTGLSYAELQDIPEEYLRQMSSFAPHPLLGLPYTQHPLFDKERLPYFANWQQWLNRFEDPATTREEKIGLLHCMFDIGHGSWYVAGPDGRTVQADEKPNERFEFLVRLADRTGLYLLDGDPRIGLIGAARDILRKRFLTDEPNRPHDKTPAWFRGLITYTDRLRLLLWFFTVEGSYRKNENLSYSGQSSQKGIYTFAKSFALLPWKYRIWLYGLSDDYHKDTPVSQLIFDNVELFIGLLYQTNQLDYLMSEDALRNKDVDRTKVRAAVAALCKPNGPRSEAALEGGKTTTLVHILALLDAQTAAENLRQKRLRAEDALREAERRL